MSGRPVVTSTPGYVDGRNPSKYLLSCGLRQQQSPVLSLGVARLFRASEGVVSSRALGDVDGVSLGDAFGLSDAVAFGVHQDFRTIQ